MITLIPSFHHSAMITADPCQRENLQVFTFKCPREWIEAIDEAAKENHSTKSSLARLAFWDFFNKHNIEV